MVSCDDEFEAIMGISRKMSTGMKNVNLKVKSKLTAQNLAITPCGSAVWELERDGTLQDRDWQYLPRHGLK